MSLYSGHDTTLIPLLRLLGINPNNEWPPFASSVQIELYRKNVTADDVTGTYVVRVIYNDRVYALPACSDTLCPLGEFVALVSECAVDQREYDVISATPYQAGS